MHAFHIVICLLTSCCNSLSIISDTTTNVLFIYKYVYNITLYIYNLKIKYIYYFRVYTPERMVNTYILGNEKYLPTLIRVEQSRRGFGNETGVCLFDLVRRLQTFKT